RYKCFLCSLGPFCFHKKDDIWLVVSYELSQGSHCPGVAKSLTVPRHELHCFWPACASRPAIGWISIVILLSDILLSGWES
ncbi:hypothetical protein L195_g048525, partial [Trifolium pratense]